MHLFMQISWINYDENKWEFCILGLVKREVENTDSFAALQKDLSSLHQNVLYKREAEKNVKIETERLGVD